MHVPQFHGSSGDLRSISVQLRANIKGKLSSCAEATFGLGSLDLLKAGMVSLVPQHTLACVCLASKGLFYPAFILSRHCPSPHLVQALMGTDLHTPVYCGKMRAQ